MSYLMFRRGISMAPWGTLESVQLITHSYGHTMGAHSQRGYRTGRHRVTIREPYDRHPPREVIRQEAEKMGRFFDPESTEKEQMRERPVPRNHRDFALERRRFQEQLKQARLQYRIEWEARVERERAAIAAKRAEINRRKEWRRRLKDMHKQTRAQEQRKWLQMQSRARSAKKEAARRNQALWLAQVNERRQAWLDELETDSRNWVTEDKIDTIITEELFRTKYPWQYESYFENKAKKLLAEEQAYGKKSGGLAVGGYPTDDDEYPTDWAHDNEPDFNTDIFSPFDRAARQGIQMEELYYEKPQENVIQDKKQEIRDHIEKSIEEGRLGYDKNLINEVFERDESGQVIVDDGERPVEEATIDYYRKTGNLEKLIPILAKKRDRMKNEHPKAYANYRRKVERGEVRDEYAPLRAAERFGMAAMLGRESSAGRAGSEFGYGEFDDSTLAARKQEAEQKSADDFAKIFDDEVPEDDWTKEVADFTDGEQSGGSPGTRE